MPTSLPFFLGPDDEKNFFRFLEKYNLTMYPNRIPPGWKAPKVSADVIPQLDEEAYYLAAEEMGPVVVRNVKRGPDKGAMEVAEVDCPVMHYERSVMDEKGQLRSGRLWAELNLTGDMQKNPAFGFAFFTMLTEIKEHLNTRYLRSTPAGIVIGHHAARLSKKGTILREAGRTGGTFVPYLKPVHK